MFVLFTRIKAYLVLHINCRLLLIRFQPNLEFLDRFSYKPLISIFTKIRPVGVTLIKVDRHEEVSGRFSRLMRMCLNIERCIYSAYISVIT